MVQKSATSRLDEALGQSSFPQSNDGGQAMTKPSKDPLLSSGYGFGSLGWRVFTYQVYLLGTEYGGLGRRLQVMIYSERRRVAVLCSSTLVPSSGDEG